MRSWRINNSSLGRNLTRVEKRANVSASEKKSTALDREKATERERERKRERERERDRVSDRETPMCVSVTCDRKLLEG